MKKCLFLILLIVFCLGTAAARGEGTNYIEKYAYEARPVADETGNSETVRMEIIHRPGETEYHSLIESSKNREEIRIKMDEEGRFISGTRKNLSFDDKLQSEGIIRREGNRILLEENEAGDRRIKSYELTEGRRFAIDGSLLLLLRSFPFGSGEAWKIFMVDFSGYSITVDASLGGSEMIEVPAGRFDCYRMEVVVDIPLLRPRLVYWLAKERPHYLVKSIGKRGPLTETYVTDLVSKE